MRYSLRKESKKRESKDKEDSESSKRSNIWITGVSEKEHEGLKGEKIRVIQETFLEVTWVSRLNEQNEDHSRAFNPEIKEHQKERDFECFQRERERKQRLGN